VDRIEQSLSVSYRFSLIWGFACAAILVPFGGDIIEFVSSDTLVVSSAGMFLKIVPLTFGFMGVGMIAGSCMVALGRPMPNLIMSLMRMAVVYIPLAILGDRLMGYLGIFLATAFANIIMGVIAWLWNKRVLAHEISQRAASTVPGLRG
jgi:Na+-driven multidrug efflux pump